MAENRLMKMTQNRAKSLDDLGAAKPVVSASAAVQEAPRKPGRPPKLGRDKSNEVRQSFGLPAEIHEEFKILMLRRKLAAQDIIAHLVAKLVDGDEYLLGIIDEFQKSSNKNK